MSTGLQLDEVTHANELAKENPRCITSNYKAMSTTVVTRIRIPNAVHVENIHLNADKTFVYSEFKFYANVWRHIFFSSRLNIYFGNGICKVFWFLVRSISTD